MGILTRVSVPRDWQMDQEYPSTRLSGSDEDAFSASIIPYDVENVQSDLKANGL